MVKQSPRTLSGQQDIKPHRNDESKKPRETLKYHINQNETRKRATLFPKINLSGDRNNREGAQ